MSGDLEALRVFLTIIEVGSVKGASVELGISRSKVRRTLETLERLVEVPLLWADSTGVHLTPAGRILQEHGTELIERHRALLHAARKLADK
ncbi:MAG: LysR family transcriptional regulator [Myxococcota bacterium]